MAELRPGVLAELLAGINAVGLATMKTSLGAVGLAIETQAKINASNGAHPYIPWGPPTPARGSGGGPAVISGTLRRSITTTPVVGGAGGWQCMVGLVPGFYPPYGGRHRTTSSKYGYYLETGLRNGATYKFLEPAARFVDAIAGPTIFFAAFAAAPWPRI